MRFSQTFRLVIGFTLVLKHQKYFEDEYSEKSLFGPCFERLLVNRYCKYLWIASIDHPKHKNNSNSRQNLTFTFEGLNASILIQNILSFTDVWWRQNEVGRESFTVVLLLLNHWISFLWVRSTRICNILSYHYFRPVCKSFGEDPAHGSNHI